MSGIAGIFFRDGRRAEHPDTLSLANALSHRGPDGGGTYTHGSCGLAHRMLFTTPESLHEHYPITDSVSGLTITADARLDNREELAAALGMKLGTRETTDGALILASYRKWGNQCAEHLLGDFSFAIWDGAVQRLYCARDHFGVRPFCYFASPALFIFGSEAKAVLSRREVPRRLNKYRVAEFLTERFDDKAATFYQDIDRLPAGCWMEVSAHHLHIQQYWALDPTYELQLPSDQAYADQFRELLEEAVRARLRTAYTPGALLSGGLDSSSNVVLARYILSSEHRQQLHTFTARFPDLPTCDEGKYSDAVIQQGGIASHLVYPTNENLLDDLDEMVWRHDGPIYWPTWVMDRALFRAAQAAGVRTLMSGHSGDMTISHGDGYFCELAYAGRWLHLLREASVFCQVRRWPLLQFIWEETVRPAIHTALPASILRHRATKRARVAPPYPVLNPDLERELRFTDRIREIDIGDIKLKRTLRGYHYFRLKNDWIARSLEAGDRFDLVFGLRSNYPFFDKRLMEYGLALPAEQKLRGGATRYILRKAMGDLLPPIIRNRHSKISLAPLVNRTFMAPNIMLFDTFVRDELPKLDGIVDVKYLSQKYLETRPKDFFDEDIHFPFLWQLLGPYSIGRWLSISGLTP